MRDFRQSIPVFPLDEFRPRDGSEPLLRIGKFEEGMQQMPHRFRPHRHDFFELIWLTHGRGMVQVDFENHEVSAGQLIALAPGQVHSWSLTPDFAGIVTGFFREFLSLIAGNMDFLLELPFFTGGAPVIRPRSRQTRNEILRVLVQLVRESDSGARRAARMQAALLTQLLTLAERELPEENDNTADTKLAKRFLATLGHKFSARQRLDSYAAQLGVTANHLGDAVKRSTGRPAGEWVRERALLEAKRLLAHSDLTASEIGYALGFSDPAYFGQAFRRATSKTPGAFRKAFREKLQNQSP